MSQTINHIKQSELPPMSSAAPVNVAYQRAQFKSEMVMVRFHVDAVIESGDRCRGEYIYSQLVEQCRKLAGKYGFALQ